MEPRFPVPQREPNRLWSHTPVGWTLLCCRSFLAAQTPQGHSLARGGRETPRVFLRISTNSRPLRGCLVVPQARYLRGPQGGGGDNVAPGVGAGHGRVGAAAGGRWGCADRLGSPHLPKCECFGLRLCVCAWCACPQNSRRGRRKRTRTQWECRGLLAFCLTPA